MREGKTEKLIFNSAINIIVQAVQIILSFVTRTFFIKLLGANYLGISGLYTNILSILSIAELGIGNILIYYLYKPLKDGDQDKLVKYINFSKKAYRIISIIILVVGISIIPLLPYIIDSSLDAGDLVLYYVLFLMNSVASYISIYKSNLLYADQKSYKVSLISMIIVVIQYIAQILFLLFFKNYTMYLIIQIVCVLLSNLLISYVADKTYPYLKSKSHLKLSKNEEKKIYKDVLNMVVYKVGTIMMNYTDNILISVLISTLAVGYYSNYLLITSMINLFISVVIKAISGSVGNLIAEDNFEKNKKMYYLFTYIFEVIGAYTFIILCLLSNHFINLWVGAEYLLSQQTVFIIALGFYLNCISNQNWIFREAAGLFKQIKYQMLIAAVINLLLSIILGESYGLDGILIATIIAKIVTVYWYDYYILSNNIFISNVWEYIRKQGIYIINTFILLAFCYYITLIISENFLGLIIKFIIISIVFILGFILPRIKEEETVFLIEQVKRITKK